MKPITIFLVGIGIFVIMLSTIRWYFDYPDLSNFFFGGLIGILFLLNAYFYEKLWFNAAKNEEIENRLDSHIYPLGA